MKPIKEFYKEIINYKDGEMFLKSNNTLCPTPGQKLETPQMTAIISKVEYLIDRHSIKITIDNGQSINRKQIVDLIQNGTIKEIN